MGIDIVIARHGEPTMYLLAGPFLCDRSVHKELGGPIYSESNTWWFFAVDEEDASGFCSLRDTDAAYWLDYEYVVPEKRGEGIFTALEERRDERIAQLPPKPLRVVAREPRWTHYEARGFSVQSRRGQWVYGVKEAS